MAKFIIPDITKHDSAREFFQELYRLNLGVREFSLRYLCKILRWPPSYLPDVLKNRKKLSVARAVQFGRVLQLDLFTREKLVYLALIEVQGIRTEDLQDVFTKFRKSELLQSSSPVDLSLSISIPIEKREIVLSILDHAMVCWKDCEAKQGSSSDVRENKFQLSVKAHIK